MPVRARACVIAVAVKVAARGRVGPSSDRGPVRKGPLREVASARGGRGIAGLARHASADFAGFIYSGLATHQALHGPTHGRAPKGGASEGGRVVLAAAASAGGPLAGVTLVPDHRNADGDGTVVKGSTLPQTGQADYWVGPSGAPSSTLVAARGAKGASGVGTAPVTSLPPATPVALLKGGATRWPTEPSPPRGRRPRRRSGGCSAHGGPRGCAVRAASFGHGEGPPLRGGLARPRGIVIEGRTRPHELYLGILDEIARRARHPSIGARSNRTRQHGHGG